VGSEKVIGHDTTKYQARFRDKEGKGAGFVWVTDSGVPIKMEMMYSNKDIKSQRMSIAFTELNLRKQDPKYFEVPSNLKPMGLGAGLSNIGQMMGMGGGAPAAKPTASASPSSAEPSPQSDLADARKRCLEAAALAADEAKKEKKGGMFGSLMGAVSELGSMADRFGLTGANDPVAAAYAPNASAEDIEAAAEKLGVSVVDIERCRRP
jgi:hypothetical protein